MSSEALKVGRTALKFIPTDATVRFNIANILGKEGRFEEAEVEFKEAISREPTNPSIITNLGGKKIQLFFDRSLLGKL